MASDKPAGEDYINTLKMAIALACIRSKPVGMTAAEYTEQMCQNFLRKQQSCQEKLKSAENEILHLKQQLMLQATLDPNFTKHSYSTVESDVSCLTPPSSGISADRSQSELDTANLMKHTVFLQSILNLQTITRTPQLTSVTYSTIQSSLTMIKCCLEDEASFPMSLIHKNVHVIMRLLDSEKIVDLVQIVDGVIDIVKCVLNILLLKDHETMEQADGLVVLVTDFCHVKLFDKIMKMNLTAIEDFSHHLRKVKDKKEKIDIVKYWNLYHLFRILENIIYKHRQHTLMASTDFLSKINDRLDQTLLHLTDPFPVFAHAVWKIQGIVNQFEVLK